MSSRKIKLKEIGGNRSMDENTKAVTMMKESHFSFDDLPIGFRFLPTDEELIRYYLINKVLNKPLPLNKFIDLNIYCFNPDQLAEIYGGREQNEPMYFFSPRERKYPNGSRPNRVVAGTGHWRASGKEKHIPMIGPTIGFERALGFHEGKSRKDKKTKWIMHEYRVNSEYLNVPSTRTPMKLDDWPVLCKIYENGRGQKGKSTDEKQDENPSKASFPHDDHADQGGRACAIISSPPRTTLLLVNQVPPVPNNYDLSNALNSSCQFDQYYSGQMISAFGEHDHHHDPIACGEIGLHNYANLADDPFFNTNITRPDDHHHHVFAAPVPYSANSALDWCDIDDQGRRKDDDDWRGFQLLGPAFNDPLGNPDNFAHTDDVLIFYDARPSSGFAGDLDQSDQLLPMFDASCDDNQNFGSGSTARDSMFSENTEPDQNTEPDRTSIMIRSAGPELPHCDFSFLDKF